MLGTAARYSCKKPKAAIEVRAPPEKRQTITKAIYEIVKEHGPLTISDAWERLKEVAPQELTGKRHMKVVLRWMRDRQKLRIICNRVGPHKQFLYTTWFTKSDIPGQPINDTRTSQPKLP